MSNVGAFAERSFILGGDPVAVTTSASVWSRFAADAIDTSTELRHLTTADFQGDESDTYRTKISCDLPPYLDTTSQAWTMVSQALQCYAGTLADLQAQLSSLRSTAWAQWQTATAADAAAGQAESADATHAIEWERRAQQLEPDHALPPDTYRASGAPARARAAADVAAYKGTVSRADQLREMHTEAVQACVNSIDRARAIRFADPPHWLGRLWEKACDWVADHVDILQTLSVVLKQISAVAGTLAMIPVLAPLAGPVAAGAGALAFGIDTGIKLTTGQGSWTDIALTGMAFIPGARAAMASDILSTGHDAITGDLDWTQLAMTVAFGGRGGKHRQGDQPRTAQPMSASGRSPTEPHQTARAPKPIGLQPHGARDHLPSADEAKPSATLERPPDEAHSEGAGPASPGARTDDPHLDSLRARRQRLPPSDRHLLDYDPSLPGIPSGWHGRAAENGNGWIWQDPSCVGTERRILRIMGPVHGRYPYPSGYVRLRDDAGEYRGINGKVSQPRNLSHLRREADGSYEVPEGWKDVLG